MSHVIAMALALTVGTGVAASGCRGVEDGGGSSQGNSDDAGAEADSAVALGELAVRQRNCAQCHQSADPAAGILSGQLSPLPGTEIYGSNLTPDPDTGMDAWSIAQITSALTEGVDEKGAPLCPAMPVYCDMMPDEASFIAAYLRSLTAVWRPIPASVCPPYEPLPEGGVGVSRGDVCGSHED